MAWNAQKQFCCHDREGGTHLQNGVAGKGPSDEARLLLKPEGSKSQEVVPVGEKSIYKGPEARKRLVPKRARRRAAVAITHRGRRGWIEMRSDRQTWSGKCHSPWIMVSLILF